MTAPAFEIECPSCHHCFALDQIYATQIEARLQKDFEAKVQTLRQKEQDMAAKAADLQKAQAALDDEVRKRLQNERENLLRQAKEQIQERYQVELKDLKCQLTDKAQQLANAHQKELEFRQKIRAVDEKEKNLELEIQRRCDEQASRTAEATRRELQEQFKTVRREYEERENGLKNKVMELTHKLEQKSQQAQGEILELVLETELKTLFPFDAITPVPKGVSGADVIQTVHNGHGKACGSIVWEFKNTKHWSDGWIQKLKDDQRRLKADLAVLLTATLPKEIKGFGHLQGIWIADLSSYASLCLALRMHLMQLYLTQQAQHGKSEKMEILYRYLSGHEFRQRVQSIVEAFQAMKSDLEKEKTAMQKIWAKREKEIDRVVAATSGMYGDLEGMLGNTLPLVEGLELTALAAPE